MATIKSKTIVYICTEDESIDEELREHSRGGFSLASIDYEYHKIGGGYDIKVVLTPKS